MSGRVIKGQPVRHSTVDENPIHLTVDNVCGAAVAGAKLAWEYRKPISIVYYAYSGAWFPVACSMLS